MLSRRHFLQNSALLAFAPLVPAFVPRLALGAEPDADGRILVVIQLDGGNDGLNTVIPFSDDLYARARPTLRYHRDAVLRLDDRIGLHPSMRGARELVEDGRLAIVQSVGYPNPNRSHFDSMAIWHTARFAPEERRGNGWIGTALDDVPRVGSGWADAVYVGADDVPRALLGRRSMAAGLSRGDDLELRLPMTVDPNEPRPTGDDVQSFVRRRVLDAVASARDLAEAARSSGDASYPPTPLARQMSLIARLIKAGGGTRVYYVTQVGYDTHGGQQGQHAQLLGDLSGSLKAFLDDLRVHKLDDRVVVLAFSEFGRRVVENNSQGTDHGTAGPVFLAGPAVRGGLHGEPPDLKNLEEGDLRTAVDFRQIYATVLTDWLGVPATAALAGKFDPLPLLRS